MTPDLLLNDRPGLRMQRTHQFGKVANDVRWTSGAMGFAVATARQRVRKSCTDLGCIVAMCMASLSASAASPAASLPPGLYALTTETLLPHLEEALRYATVKSTRCIGGEAADSFFPLLQHEALAGCHLAATATANAFALTCRNPEAASGQARFEHSPTHLRAVLELKMGGKNMTLSQRVVGTRIGNCD